MQAWGRALSIRARSWGKFIHPVLICVRAHVGYFRLSYALWNDKLYLSPSKCFFSVSKDGGAGTAFGIAVGEEDFDAHDCFCSDFGEAAVDAGEAGWGGVVSISQ